MSRRRIFRLPPARPERRADDVDQEIRLHIELRVEQLVGEGWTRDDALAEARRRFGLEGVARTELLVAAERRERRLAREEWLDSLRRDLVFALRQLRHARAFALAAVLTLALGIGANATMFGVVDRLLLRPPAHVADPGALARLYIERDPDAFGGGVTPMLSYPSFVALRDSMRSVTALAGFFPARLIVGEGDEARETRVVQATGNYFSTLGVRPHAGRFFTVDEDAPPHGARVAVLGYRYWRTRYGASMEVIGQPVVVEGVRYTIVGVAPEGFTGVELEPVELFVPLSAIAAQQRGGDWHRNAGMAFIRAVARTSGDAMRVASEATTVLRRAAPDTTSFDHGATVMASSVIAARAPGRSERRDRAAVATGLTAVAGIVLIIACANVANLLLLRGVRRRRELAVRVALGVGRGRLLRQLLTESAVLAVAGGIAGVLLAWWGGGVVRAVLLPDIDWSGGVIDARVLFFALGATALTGLLTGLVPALQATRGDVVQGLKLGTRDGGARRSRLQAGLLIAQTGLSVLLLACAGLFARSLHRIQALDYGYEPDRVLVAVLSMPSSVTAEREMAAYDLMLERARTLPVIEQAALTTTTPFWSMAAGDLAIPGIDSLPTLAEDYPLINAVTSDYFATTGLRVVRGRAFAPDDRFGAPRVALVNEAMAGSIWKGRDPIGQCIKVGGDTVPCSEVVGVVATMVQSDLRERGRSQYYVPIEQRQALDMRLRALVARPRGDAREAVETLRRELVAAAPGALYVSVQLLQELIDPQVRPWKLGATMFGVFGALALLIAAVGLYSVIAYEVARRGHEMGVRMALGASGRDLARMVVSGALRVTSIGLLIGAAVSLAGARWLEPMLFRVAPRDPLVFGTVMLTLLAAALLATMIPAMRASRANPQDALRAD